MVTSNQVANIQFFHNSHAELTSGLLAWCWPSPPWWPPWSSLPAPRYSAFQTPTPARKVRPHQKSLNDEWINDFSNLNLQGWSMPSVSARGTTSLGWRQAPTPSGTGRAQGTTAASSAWTPSPSTRLLSRNGWKTWSGDVVHKSVLILTIVFRSEELHYIWTGGRKCNFKGCDRKDLQPAIVNGW